MPLIRPALQLRCRSLAPDLRPRVGFCGHGQRWGGASLVAAALALGGLPLMAGPQSAASQSAGPLAPAAAPQMETLSPQEVREGLRRALAMGQNELAHDLALALTTAFPRDFSAHAALAEAQIRLRRAGPALATARRAQGLAQGATQDFEANLLRARATGLSGGAVDGVVANYWARRAVELAPLEGYRNLARGEAQKLRASAPLEVQLSLSVSPSSNVNNGSREREFTLPGWEGISFALSPQSRALSGWIAEASLAGRYRLRSDAARATGLTFAVHHRAVRLSSEAREALEGWQAGQMAMGNPRPEMPRYDYTVLEAGLSEIRRAGQAGLWSLRAVAGSSWFGGRDLNDYLRLETGLEHPRGRDILRASVSMEKQWGRAGNARDAEILGLEMGATRQLAAGDRLRLAGNLRHHQSPSVDQRHDAAGLKLGWIKAAPVAGMQIEASFGAELRQYDPSVLSSAGRRDLRLDAQLSLGVDKLTYMGFSPVLNLNLGRVNSNIALYEGATGGISLKLRSNF